MPAELPEVGGATPSELVDPPLDERVRTFCEERFQEIFGREWDAKLLPSHARAQALKARRIELSDRILSALDALKKALNSIEDNILSSKNAFLKIDNQEPKIAQYDLNIVDRLLGELGKDRPAYWVHIGDIHMLDNEESEVEEYEFYEAQGVGIRALLSLANRLVVRNYILCHTLYPHDIGNVKTTAIDPGRATVQNEQHLLAPRKEDSLTMSERGEQFEALIQQRQTMQITETRTVLDDLVSSLLFHPDWRVCDEGKLRKPKNSEMAVVAILLGYGPAPSLAEKRRPKSYVNKVADTIRKIQTRRSAPKSKNHSEG